MMSRKQFEDELNLKERDIKVSIPDVYKTFTEKVEPYLDLINHWKFQEKMQVEDIRLSLGITKYEWTLFASMDTVKNYTRKSGDFMKARTQKEFVDAKKDNMNNAKFHEMSFKRFDSGFGDKGSVNIALPSTINFEIQDAEMEDAQIEEEIDD